MTIKVTRAGFLTTVQDPGRTGHRASGVSLGGALDSHALRVANLLVGNEASAAGVEVTLGKSQMRFADDRLIAWCGGEFLVKAGDMLLGAGRPALVRADEDVVIDAPPSGGRAWLAFSGGIDVPLVLESRSTDLRSRFGGHEGRALRDGDVLKLGLPSEFSLALTKKLQGSRIASWSSPNEWSNTTSPHRILQIVRGAEWDQFAPATLGSLTSESFVVGPDSDRMGIRLEGVELPREMKTDLISEAVAPGTVQVPPNGHPILLLGDCQTIGGYPKIAHVITVDLPAAAQLWPGDDVRFAEVSLAHAHHLLLARERDFERFRVGLSLRVL